MSFKSVLGATTVFLLAAGIAQAGGLDRTRLPYAALFESGRYVELGFSNVSPDVTGAYSATLTGLGGSASTGNMAQSYTSLSFAYKADITEKLAYALFINTPYGADAAYGTGFYTGLQAEWSSQQIAALLKYKPTDSVSVYGGLRYVQSTATIQLPSQVFGTFATTVGNYTAVGDRNGQFGYVIGAAYERPDIALRVGLTYENAITHDFATQETFTGAVAPLGGPSVTEITLPQSVTLDFQSGVAKDTLVFGMLRWSEWSAWQVSPPIYAGVVTTAPVITGFDNDVLTYQLGVGRRINDSLSVFARATYEKAHGGVSSRLSPTDGTRGIGIGATWRQDNMKITGGIEYAKLGDAVDSTGTVFGGNSAVGVGITVGFTF